ncbi:energy-coupling factor ABC transporter ATP-binding protein [Bifidobacterium psychraerophilum]|uniref:ABC transporter ATP-binding protein n=1 Tax=Bifidobacterium psychraerophilum TaxID=218140 RepID=UPI00310E93EE
MNRREKDMEHSGISSAESLDSGQSHHGNAVAHIDHVSFWYGSAPTRHSTYYTTAADDGTADVKRTDRATLNDISLDIRPGTITLLCGASGSGKTSALQLLNGLVPHFHQGTITGHVRVADLDLSTADLSACGEVSATVFQNPKTQFFTSAVRSELAFRMENHAVPRSQIVSNVARAARDGDIEELMGRHLNELSGGELQKVACAQAIGADTPLLLFDEPTSNLSVEAIEEFAGMLARLKRQGRTVVIAEHRLYFLKGLVEQAVLLDSGRISEIMDGDEFFAQSDEARRRRGLRSLEEPVVATAPVTEQGGNGLTLDNLRFAYRKKAVLDISHVQFPEGSVSALVGANGAGKSTLARLICGLLKERGGSGISLDGATVSHRDRTRMSYIVMQDVHRQLFSESLRKEVTLGQSSAEREAVDVPSLLKEFDLEAYADRHPLSLSGGQKQRLVIASAIACDKRVYVFDEPTSGVDYRHLIAIAKRLRSLARSGAIVIVITHDTELLRACADRIVTLHALSESEGGSHIQVESVVRQEEAEIR